MLPTNARLTDFQASFWKLMKKPNRRKLKFLLWDTIKSWTEEHLTSLFLLALGTKCRYITGVLRSGCKRPPVYKTLEQNHQTRIVKAKAGNSFKRSEG